jgi:pSer/pThr/pTyr-binding forkhead associated (FHA) protein
MATVEQEVVPSIGVEYLLVPLHAGAPSVVLTHFPVRIGRGARADVRLDDIHVSRRHCEIIAIDGALAVYDLGSTNGTFVNGVRIGFSPLDAGDVLILGETGFVVKSQPAIAKPLDVR